METMLERRTGENTHAIHAADVNCKVYVDMKSKAEKRANFWFAANKLIARRKWCGQHVIKSVARELLQRYDSSKCDVHKYS